MRIIIASMPFVALTAILSVSAVHHIDRVAIANTSESALPETVAIWQRMRANKAQQFLHTRPKIKVNTNWSSIPS